VTFHEPVRLDQFGGRKGLAEHCQNVISVGVAAAIAGALQPAAPARAT
jgi:1-acyl-sn-glycerol-3-phosphate acyltransferase